MNVVAHPPATTPRADGLGPIEWMRRAIARLGARLRDGGAILTRARRAVLALLPSRELGTVEALPHPLPASSRHPDLRPVEARRHHLDESAVEKAAKQPARVPVITKPTGRPASPHLRAGDDIRTIQEILGHRDVKTMISTHILDPSGGRGIVSPAVTLHRVGPSEFPAHEGEVRP
jgi:integrase